MPRTALRTALRAAELTAVLGAMAGERDEDVVERRAAQPDVVDLHSTGVQFADDFGEQLAPADHRHGDLAGVLLHRGLALAQPPQHMLGDRDVLPLVHHALPPLPADAGLELVGGAAGDDLA